MSDTPRPSSTEHESVWTERTPWELIEHRLELASWKEILCRLAQGFTHDLNNALTGLTAMSDLLVSQADEQHPFHDAVHVVRQSTLKATELVRRLNLLLQSGPGKGEFADAGITLTESLELLQKAIPRRVRVKQEIASEPLPVRADMWHLRLLLLHLLLNALEAMPEGGNLFLQAERSQSAPTGSPAVGQLPLGPWIRLSISDTGLAFVPAAESFQPWFGTKSSHMGTGLGLFIARRFCERNQGALYVAAQEGLGTTVELWLHEADLTADEPEPSHRRLLLAGRDPSQVDALAGLCRGRGYSVLVAPDLLGLPRLLAVNPAEFDAILLVGSPAEMKSLLQWLRREKLPIRKVFITEQTEVPEADLVLQTPEPEVLFRRLKELLG